MKIEVSFLISYRKEWLSFAKKRKFCGKPDYSVQFLVITWFWTAIFKKIIVSYEICRVK